MAIAGTLRASGTFNGLLTGSKLVDVQWTIAAGAPTVALVSLGAGATVQTAVPTGTTVIVIVPPTGNANAITLKGVVGDVGAAIGTQTPTIVSWANTANPLILSAPGAGVNNIEVSFL